jgi:hypothetical protein
MRKQNIVLFSSSFLIFLFVLGVYLYFSSTVSMKFSAQNIANVL